jgi:hypothetical protein
MSPAVRISALSVTLLGTSHRKEGPAVLKDNFMDERKRDSIIAYLRRRMEEFGIEPEGLALELASDRSKHKDVRYHSATDETENLSACPK